MFKPATPLDVQIANLYQDITGRQPTPQQLAKWIQDIKNKKISLADLRAAMLAAQSQAEQTRDIEHTAETMDQESSGGGSWSVLASAAAVPMSGAATGGSSMIGIIAGGVAVAAAAGGGGGGGGGGNAVTTTVSTKTFTVGTAPLLVDPYWWLGDAVSVDLNRDGVNELIVLGSKSQPSTIANWSDSYIQILGFNTGRLAIETSRWLPGSTNRVLGAVGGKITGDFNGDGYTDLWIGPSTDMRHYGPGVVLFNQNGQSLRRVEVDIGDMWVHDVAIADFNRDGFDDILPLGWGPDHKLLLGKSDSSFTIVNPAAQTAYGAGIAAADFLGNGTITFVITDTETIGISDTGLYTMFMDHRGYWLERIATLPAERFTLPKWQTGEYDWDWIPHSIRVLAHDFDRDRDPDAIVFTTYYDNNIGGHAQSEVQFLRNNGNASFTDVTDNVLLNYNHRTSLGISPRLVDINDDGVLDIWLTSGDGDGSEDSSRVLLANRDGTYQDIMGSALAQFRADIGGETSFVHYMEDGQGRDYVVGIEKYSYSGNNQVEFVAAPLKNYYSADWIA